MRLQDICLAAALSSALVALPAHAQDAAVSVEGSVTAVSDYVWRGVSQTREKPALQLEVTATHTASGMYAGVFAANVDFTAVDEDDDGIRYELAPYLGWSTEFANGSSVDVALSRVLYPGHKPDNKLDYTELEATYHFPQGVYAGVAYSPDIFNMGGRGLYYNVGGQWDVGEDGWSVQAQLGYYDLEKAAGDSYGDYLLGIQRSFGDFNVGVEFTGTSSYGAALDENLDDAKLAKHRFALKLGYSF